MTAGGSDRRTSRRCAHMGPCRLTTQAFERAMLVEEPAHIMDGDWKPARSGIIPRLCLKGSGVKVKRPPGECGESHSFDFQHVRGNSEASHLD